jgi:hypothetical protein
MTVMTINGGRCGKVYARSMHHLTVLQGGQMALHLLSAPWLVDDDCGNDHRDDEQ